MTGKDQMQITFQPSVRQMQHIKKWLAAEERKSGDGFYCNWNIIEKAGTQNRIAVLLINDHPISFVIWTPNDASVRIDITETHPTYRKKGLGKMLIDGLCRYLVRNGFMVIDLHCEPTITEKIWRCMGFIDFPDVAGFVDINSLYYKHLYKPLVLAADPLKQSAGSETIELWNDEPMLAEANREPDWIWYPQYKLGSNTLRVPIIFPCREDWRICWRNGQQVIQDEKAKYFQNGNAHSGRYLVIRQLMPG